MRPVFLALPPSPDLTGWIRQHQLIRFRFAAAGDVPAKPYWPRPASALAFYPRDPETLVDEQGRELVRKPRTALIGQPTVLTRRRGGADFFVYQVEFAPGALHRLGGPPLQTITDDTLDAELVFPDLVPVARRIADTEAPDQMIQATEAWVRTRLAASPGEAAAVDWAAGRLLSGSARSLEKLAGRAGLAQRTFQRQFRERMGVSPKLFARIARLDRLIRARNLDPRADWLGLAIEAGYYDHQHMARDFRAFCLAGPSEFYALESAAPERRFGIREA